VTTYPVRTCFHEAGHAVVAAALGLEVQNICINKDESGKTDVSGGSLSFIEQVACCFAGDEAQDIWHPCADWGGSGDLQQFLRLAQGLSQEQRDALEKAGCELARELLYKNKSHVEIVAQRLVQQGYMTGTEFKHLTGTLEPGPC
jgi:Peptidase M50B-like